MNNDSENVNQSINARLKAKRPEVKNRQKECEQ